MSKAWIVAKGPHHEEDPVRVFDTEAAAEAFAGELRDKEPPYPQGDEIIVMDAPLVIATPCFFCGCIFVDKRAEP